LGKWSIGVHKIYVRGDNTNIHKELFRAILTIYYTQQLTSNNERKMRNNDQVKDRFFTLRLSDNLAKKLMDMSNNSKRTKSGVLRILIENAYSQFENSNKLKEESWEK